MFMYVSNIILPFATQITHDSTPFAFKSYGNFCLLHLCMCVGQIAWNPTVYTDKWVWLINVCTSIYVHQIQILSNVFMKSSKCVQSLVVREYKIIDLNEHSISVWVWMLIVFFYFLKSETESVRENYFRLKCFIIFRVFLTGNSLQRFLKTKNQHHDCTKWELYSLWLYFCTYVSSIQHRTDKNLV